MLKASRVHLVTRALQVRKDQAVGKDLVEVMVRLARKGSLDPVVFQAPVGHPDLKGQQAPLAWRVMMEPMDQLGRKVTVVTLGHQGLVVKPDLEDPEENVEPKDLLARLDQKAQLVQLASPVLAVHRASRVLSVHRVLKALVDPRVQWAKQVTQDPLGNVVNAATGVLGERQDRLDLMDPPERRVPEDRVESAVPWDLKVVLASRDPTDLMASREIRAPQERLVTLDQEALLGNAEVLVQWVQLVFRVLVESVVRQVRPALKAFPAIEEKRVPLERPAARVLLDQLEMLVLWALVAHQVQWDLLVRAASLVLADQQVSAVMTAP